ncbi:hypothetical protein BLNAU_13098 [Blattamonas nauphoetae]|uniref:Bromo domain-containing protein n=1 Tax=Blattamonas nauphoetae TaxID=2049346 RepID=A0ABQ9XHS9_9EUKA|nr:hypothetical protein BLNAU_13098 [Blattamonas nauphoetae]
MVLDARYSPSSFELNPQSPPSVKFTGHQGMAQNFSFKHNSLSTTSFQDDSFIPFLDDDGPAAIPHPSQDRHSSTVLPQQASLNISISNLLKPVKRTHLDLTVDSTSSPLTKQIPPHHTSTIAANLHSTTLEMFRLHSEFGLNSDDMKLRYQFIEWMEHTLNDEISRRGLSFDQSDLTTAPSADVVVKRISHYVRNPIDYTTRANQERQFSQNQSNSFAFIAKVKCHLFGSGLTGLGTKYSDVDIHVECGVPVGIPLPFALNVSPAPSISPMSQLTPDGQNQQTQYLNSVSRISRAQTSPKRSTKKPVPLKETGEYKRTMAILRLFRSCLQRRMRENSKQQWKHRHETPKEQSTSQFDLPTSISRFDNASTPSPSPPLTSSPFPTSNHSNPFDIQLIPARVPILRFTPPPPFSTPTRQPASSLPQPHPSSSLPPSIPQCDINLSGFNSLSTSQAVSSAISTSHSFTNPISPSDSPAKSPMFIYLFILKMWAKERQINDGANGYPSSFTLSVLAIFFARVWRDEFVWRTNRARRRNEETPTTAIPVTVQDESSSSPPVGLELISSQFQSQSPFLSSDTFIPIDPPSSTPPSPPISPSSALPLSISAISDSLPSLLLYGFFLYYGWLHPYSSSSSNEVVTTSLSFSSVTTGCVCDARGFSNDDLVSALLGTSIDLPHSFVPLLSRIDRPSNDDQFDEQFDSPPALVCLSLDEGGARLQPITDYQLAHFVNECRLGERFLRERLWEGKGAQTALGQQSFSPPMPYVAVPPLTLLQFQQKNSKNSIISEEVLSTNLPLNTKRELWNRLFDPQLLVPKNDKTKEAVHLHFLLSSRFSDSIPQRLSRTARWQRELLATSKEKKKQRDKARSQHKSDIDSHSSQLKLTRVILAHSGMTIERDDDSDNTKSGPSPTSAKIRRIAKIKETHQERKRNKRRQKAERKRVMKKEAMERQAREQETVEAEIKELDSAEKDYLHSHGTRFSQIDLDALDESAEDAPKPLSVTRTRRQSQYKQAALYKLDTVEVSDSSESSTQPKKKPKQEASASEWQENATEEDEESALPIYPFVEAERFKSLKRIIKSLYSSSFSSPFRDELNTTSPKFRTYLARIRHPVDLSTVLSRIPVFKQLRKARNTVILQTNPTNLNLTPYKSTTEALENIRLIWDNALVFFGNNHPISDKARKFQQEFVRMLREDATKLNWDHNLINSLTITSDIDLWMAKTDSERLRSTAAPTVNTYKIMNLSSSELPSPSLSPTLENKQQDHIQFEQQPSPVTEVTQFMEFGTFLQDDKKNCEPFFQLRFVSCHH